MIIALHDGDHYEMFKEAMSATGPRDVIYSNGGGMFQAAASIVGGGIAITFRAATAPETFGEDFPKAIEVQNIEGI